MEQKLRDIVSKAKDLVNNKEYEEAFSIAKEAINLQHDNYELLEIMAESKYELQDYKNSLKYYEQLLKIIPKDYSKSTIYMKIGDIYRKLNDKSKALEMYRKLVNYDSSIHNRGLLSAYLAVLGNIEEAIQIEEEIVNDIKKDNYEEYILEDKESLLQLYEMSLARLYFISLEKLFVEFPQGDMRIVDKNNAKKALNILNKAIKLKHLTPEFQAEIKKAYGNAVWTNEKHWDFKYEYRILSNTLSIAFLMIVIVLALLSSKTLIGFILAGILIFLYTRTKYIPGWKINAHELYAIKEYYNK